MYDADVIVIGSGAAGMASALCMAQAGKKVLVLEQHYVPGGWCHSFYIDGFRFSPGVHFVGQLSEGNPSRIIFEGLGIANDISFFQQNTDAYDHARLGTMNFDFPTGKDALIQRLQRRFPKEKIGIKYYLDLVEKVTQEIHVIPNLDGFLDHLFVVWNTRHLGRYGLFSLQRVLGWYIKNPILKALLSIHSGNHGLPPSQVPFPLHAAVMDHTMNGCFYPQGGGAAITKAFTKNIKKHGGTIKVNSKVDEIMVKPKGKGYKAVGVKLTNGETYYAPIIISNADPHGTYIKMVKREYLSPKLQKKIDRTKYSVAALNLFLVVNMDLRAAGLDSGNIWYMAHPDLDGVYDSMMNKQLFEEKYFRGLFITSPTLKDPSSYDGKHHTLEVITYVNYEAFLPFKDSEFEKRPQAYYDLKEQLFLKLMQSLDRIIPGLSKHVITYELGTPLSSTHYVGSTHGNCYGIEKNFRQFGPLSFKSKTEIEGLFMAGASTTAHGIAGSAQTGVGTAALALGCKPKELLNRTQGQYLNIYLSEDETTWPEEVKKKIAVKKRKLEMRERKLRDKVKTT